MFFLFLPFYILGFTEITARHICSINLINKKCYCEKMNGINNLRDFKENMKVLVIRIWKINFCYTNFSC